MAHLFVSKFSLEFGGRAFLDPHPLTADFTYVLFVPSTCTRGQAPEEKLTVALTVVPQSYLPVPFNS